jgi:hypothetical protein
VKVCSTVDVCWRSIYDIYDANLQVVDVVALQEMSCWSRWVRWRGDQKALLWMTNVDNVGEKQE